jgi:uncharacterized membrane protein YbaN (DUF454 family)
VPDKAIVGVMLVTAVVLWIFVPGSTSTIFIVIGIAALALASARRKKKVAKPKVPGV